MTMAVIDRFEGENAVLLVGKNEQQVIFPYLPDMSGRFPR